MPKLSCYYDFMQLQKALLNSIVLVLALSASPAHGEDLFQEAEDWQQRCLDKILKNYSGPSLNEGDHNIAVEFTMLPDGTAKWPHRGSGGWNATPNDSLNTNQMEKLKGLKAAILKASPFEKYLSTWVLKRSVGAVVIRDNGKPYFWTIDYAGSWTQNIFQSTKPEQWKEILDPITKHFVAPKHTKEVHACVYLVIGPDGKILDNYSARCTRVKCQSKELYSEIGAAQKALVSAIKQSSPFSVERLYGAEPKPIAAYVIYRSYQTPQLQLYSALYGRCCNYVDLYEHGETKPTQK